MEPWPHLVLDDFLSSEAIDIATAEVESYSYEYEIDQRGDGRIEFALLRSKTLWKEIYSLSMIRTISEAFRLQVTLNKKNLIQLRRMTENTPAFPLHNDFILGSNTIVSLLYLSRCWRADNGGRLLLHESGLASDPTKIIDPICNRLVAFRTKAEHWHSVEKVSGWDRRCALAVWDIVE